MTTVDLPTQVKFTEPSLLSSLVLPFFTLTAIFGQPTTEDALKFIIMAQLEGQVMVQNSDGDWQLAKEHQIIYAGARLLLDEYASATIVTETGNRYQLKPNSEIHLQADGLRAIRGTLQRLPTLTLASFIGPLPSDTSSRSVCGAGRWSGVRLNGPGWLPIKRQANDTDR